MTLTKKDICPICNTNYKGVKSKTCGPCRIKAMTKEGKIVERNNNTSNVRVGDVTEDGKYYL